MRYCLLLFFYVAFQFSTRAALTIADKGKAQITIVRQTGATAAEVHAADELVATLQQVTGATFTVSTNSKAENTIIIGPGEVAKELFPGVPLEKLGPDEIVMQRQGNRLLLAGGRPRGTMYAVNRFLQEQCGVRWWTAWATNIPNRPTLKIGPLNVRYTPPFEYRAPFWYCAFDQHWKAHNECNDENWTIPAELGGSIKYKGFAHTFNRLVPPDKHFKEHPEWFSMVGGKRIPDGQLCLTDPQLRDFVVERVKQWLRESPDCEIVSVTQNDWFRFCECPKCKAVDDAEESHAGTMISFVNYIAEKIEPEFPKVLVDTFAYQYTRKPPKTVKPRHNVTVRLCSIECNFREPLDHPSNAAFADDIKKWSAICSHLYIWDYVTDFKNYVHPHPNWFTIGANIRFFQRYGVKGIFEEGAYAGPGAEMQELRSWLLAQMMWNPNQDDQALTREFCEGYYGKEAGQAIYKYLEIIHDASKRQFIRCYLRKELPPYLSFATLGPAELLWQKAEQSVANDPDKLWRVRISHLPVRFAYIKYWDWLRHDAWEQNRSWPLPESRKAVADEFRTVANGASDKPWTHVHVLSEHGNTVDEFLTQFGADTTPVGPSPTPRLKHAAPPADLPSYTRHAVDLQENVAQAAAPKLGQIMPDEIASDHRAFRMPGNHSEWAFRISGHALPAKAKSGTWKIYVVVRVETNSPPASDSVIWSAGVYDNSTKTHPAELKAKAGNEMTGYHSILLGEAELRPDRDIFISPMSNPAIKAVWIDRVILLPAK